jgi:hypothetical protein
MRHLYTPLMYIMSYLVFINGGEANIHLMLNFDVVISDTTPIHASLELL